MIQMVVLGIKMGLFCDCGLVDKPSLYSAERIDFTLLSREVKDSRKQPSSSITRQGGEPSQ